MHKNCRKGKVSGLFQSLYIYCSMKMTAVISIFTWDALFMSVSMSSLLLGQQLIVLKVMYVYLVKIKNNTKSLQNMGCVCNDLIVNRAIFLLRLSGVKS